jgi:hypothetical protein
MPADTSRVDHPSGNPDRLTERVEDALDPALPIVDPHHHLSERPSNRYFPRRTAR